MKEPISPSTQSRYHLKKLCKWQSARRRMNANKWEERGIMHTLRTPEGLGAVSKNTRTQGGRGSRPGFAVFLRVLFYCSLAALRSLRVRNRHEQRWIPTRPYPTGFEMSGLVAKSRAGSPCLRYLAGCCPPVTRLNHRVFENPGYVNTQGTAWSPPGRSIPARLFCTSHRVFFFFFLATKPGSVCRFSTLSVLAAQWGRCPVFLAKSLNCCILL